MKALVSILIPAFNAEKWLAQTIRSAVAQRWPRKEVVVIVDEVPWIFAQQTGEGTHTHDTTPIALTSPFD